MGYAAHIQGLNYRLAVQPSLVGSACVSPSHLLWDQGFSSAHSVQPGQLAAPGGQSGSLTESQDSKRVVSLCMPALWKARGSYDHVSFIF